MSDLAKSSLLAAALNSFVAILLRILTFISNAFILRFISREALGIINVRLLLFSDTVLFVSREAFRKACLGRSVNGDWSGTINLIWLACPISAAASLCLGYVWKNYLELPTDPLEAVQYRTAIDLMSVGVVLETLVEPFFIVGQVNKFVRFRSFTDFIHLATRTFLMVAVAMLSPNSSIILFGYAHLVATTVMFLINVGYFAYVIKISHEETFSLKSFKDFFPNFSRGFDSTELQFSRAFFKQGVVKQLLTEGEKYLMTCFSLIPLHAQGVYDVVGNLGSLAARLVFSKIEESAYFYFTQTVSRNGSEPDKAKDTEALQHLSKLLRWMTSLGICISVFGFSFSHLLLYIYGGQTLSDGLGTQLMRGHCIFILFMAVNGISECFAFAVMSRSEVDSYNYVLGLLTIAFLSLAWLFSAFLGPVGFIVANCCNFAFRICHNFYIIHRRHLFLKQGTSSPLVNLVPSNVTLVTFIISGTVCRLSEMFVYNPKDFYAIVSHLGIGAVTFLATIVLILIEEPTLKQIVLNMRSKIKRS